MQKALKNYTILIVDNEEAVINALKRALRNEGYQIITASSGQEALFKLETFKCQVILADQKMPEMTGVELVNQINILYPDAVKILVTAQIEIEKIKKAAGNDSIYSIIPKPWDPEGLKEVIQSAFIHYNQRINRRNK